MKKRNLILATAVLLLGGFALQAQVSTLACDNPVDQDCVGACNSGLGELTYTAPSTGTSATTICLDNTEYSLCPSHRAGAKVWINGQPQGLYLISPGFHEEFELEPGDVLKVRFGTRIKNPGILCLWLGNVTLALSN